MVVTILLLLGVNDDDDGEEGSVTFLNPPLKATLEKENFFAVLSAVGDEGVSLMLVSF